MDPGPADDTTPDPSVVYTYADSEETSGGVDYVRVDRITYPNTRDVFYNDPSTATDIGAVLNRVDNIDGQNKGGQGHKGS